jgi:hypothetical protein
MAIQQIYEGTDLSDCALKEAPLRHSCLLRLPAIRLLRLARHS